MAARRPATRAGPCAGTAQLPNELTSTETTISRRCRGRILLPSPVLRRGERECRVKTIPSPESMGSSLRLPVRSCACMCLEINVPHCAHVISPNKPPERGHWPAGREIKHYCPPSSSCKSDLTQGWSWDHLGHGRCFGGYTSHEHDVRAELPPPGRPAPSGQPHTRAAPSWLLKSPWTRSHSLTNPAAAASRVME